MMAVTEQRGGRGELGRQECQASNQIPEISYKLRTISEPYYQDRGKKKIYDLIFNHVCTE